MLRRAHRFHGHNSLNHVYRHGSAVRGNEISLRYTVHPKRQTYRVAVVVAKKVHKSAVKRNRIRRRIFEAIRALDQQIVQPYDIVVSVHSEKVATMSAAELATLIRKQLHQATIVGSA